MLASLHLNGQSEAYPSSIDNLEGLILHTMQKRKPLNELIVDVKVDGEVFSETYEHQAGEIDLNRIGRVEVRTLEAETFSRQFLDQVAQYVDFLKGGFELTIRCLQSEDPEIGFDMLARCLDTMGCLRRHLKNVTENLGVLPEGVDLPLTRAASFESLVEALYDVQTGDNDPAVIARLLEKRVNPFLDGWKTLFENWGGGGE